MAVKAGTAYVDIEGDFSALNKQMSSRFKKLDAQASGAGKGIGKKLGAGLATGVAGAAKVGAVGIGLMTAEVIRATKGWAEHQAIVRRSNAVIKSTGGAAGVTANHVGKLSDALERQVGVDGDLIQSGANLLLTFTNIRNETGKNNKIFDQATKTTVNMSKALGQDTKSSAIQLGKALNDPVKGITALQRVGVSFTEQQRDQIKALVESGKTMDAQKIILRELNKEFPKVKATPFERLVVVGRQVEDTIGKAVLPAFNRLVRDVTPALQRIADKVEDIFGDKRTSIGEKLSKTFEAVKVEVEPLINNLMAKLRDADLGGRINDLVKQNAPKIAEGLKDVGGEAASALWTGFKEAPLWAKVLGAGFVAKALFGGGGGAGGMGGKSGPFALAGSLGAKAFKTAFEAGAIKMSTGKGIAAKVATFFTGRGTTPANPLFVADVAGGLGGGKGPKGVPPVVTPGGKPGGGGLGGWLKNAVGKIPKGVRWAGGGLAIPLTGYLAFRELVNSQRGANELPKLVAELDSLVAAGSSGNPREEQLKGILRQLDKATADKDAGKVRESAEALDQWARANPDDTRIKQIGKIADEVYRLGDSFDKFDTSAVTKKVARMSDQFGASIRGLRLRSTKDFDKLVQNVEFGSKQMLRVGGKNSEKTKEAIGHQFDLARRRVQTAMDRKIISVEEGTERLSELARKELKLYGISAGRVNVVLATGVGGQQRPTQTGGYFPGSRVGDRIHALVEEGEYVVNKKAVKKVGKRALDRLNYDVAPRFQAGGIVELLHPFNDPKGHGDHLHVAMSTVAGIIALGRRLQGLGWLVGENPAFGGIQGDHAAGGYHPKGLAIDVNWPDAGQEVAKIRALLPMLGGPMLTTLTRAFDGLQRVALQGPASVALEAGQGALDRIRSAANASIERAITPFEGAEPGGLLSVSGNGAGLMKAISNQRGWNFADWWALDYEESAHGTNLVNPTSSARLRGQFLDMNYGKYGPGSDPAQNPTMGQQIYSMAQYIAERYGNPTRAWAVWQQHEREGGAGWYQRGGLVGAVMSLFQTGGAAKKPAKVNNKALDNIKHAKTHKPKDHLSNKMIKDLGKAGATKLMGTMNNLKIDADKYADWAQRAADLVDTEKLQSALDAEMTLRGGTSDMSEQQLLSLFSVADQDAFIDTWLRTNAYISGDGMQGIQVDWLKKELDQLLAWRNALIENPPIFRDLRDAAKSAYKRLKRELKRIQDDIDALIRRRDKTKSKATKTRYSNQIERLRDKKRDVEQRMRILGGASGSEGRIGAFTESLGSMGASLEDVHGLGTTRQRFVSENEFPLGTLGGTILNVQMEKLGISANAPRASATEAGAEDSEDAMKDLIIEQQRQIIQRGLVEGFQAAVFAGLPFGGSFQDGGTVPGPVGAPRMIVAHGGEVVSANGDSNTPHVSLHFANGMEWLGKFVDIRVENQTRTQGRRSERQLPGLAGQLR